MRTFFLSFALLVLLLFLNIRAVRTQEDTTNKYNVELYSGERIFGHKIFYKDYHIHVDSTRFYQSVVKSFENKHGYFINTGLGSFGLRVVQGKINLYKKVTFYGKPAIIRGNNYKKRLDYYNFGNGEIKEVNIKNLRASLVDNPQSILYLTKARNTTIYSSAFGVGGLALAVYGIYLYNDSWDTSLSLGDAIGEAVSGIFFISTGLAAVCTSVIIGIIRTKNLKKRALKAFNGEL